MQVYAEKTIFMQKAIYFVSKLIAARGVVELTDCNLNFQVSPFDSSFGIKSISIELISIEDVRLECRGLQPRVIIIARGKKYEFSLSKGKELYSRLRKFSIDPLESPGSGINPDTTFDCCCGRTIEGYYNYCPWCGEKLER